jgi:translation initiation factor IF-2
LATVRIYKVAELLGMSSPEAMALLKQDTGIEVKSASSSIEEIVARQFVERHARRRNIALPPPSALFSETPVARRPAGKPGAKAPEPPKAAGPAMRPRLIKVIKPLGVPADAATAGSLVHNLEVEVESPASPEILVEPPTALVAAADEPELLVEEPASISLGEPEVDTLAVSADAAGLEVPAPPVPPVAPLLRPAGRLVPPTRRLRIEDPVTGEAPAARPLPQRPVVRPHTSAPAPTRPAAPLAPGQRPPMLGRSPVSPPRAPLGGPRPLPSQPVRPSVPGQRPPGSMPRPQFRPAGPRPKGPAARRDERPMMPLAPAAPPPITKLITLAEGMTVKDLADKLELKVKDVLKKLLDRRMMLTINSTLDADTAQTIARDFGAEVLIRSFEEELTEVETEASKPEDLSTRAPVVTVMGHVDHGKTTLLDAIRQTKVAEREAGGITQHIGAYSVDVNGRRVVFLDTPGHEAFTLMRARGARVTDVVILVVAADDGVMPQTKEAIDHAQAAKVPMIVAINKIDKADANPERVKRELTELGLMPEDWGGTTVTVEVSARQRKNLDQLLEMILLVSDLADLKANPKRMAHGTVLESKLDRGRGPVASVLVQDGTLNEGDLLIAGTVEGKVRALFDHLGHKVKHAGPSTPVEVLGLSAPPRPGDTFQVVDDAIKARHIASYRQAIAKEKSLGGKGGRLTLEALQQQMAEGSMKDLSIIIKADVQGSAEVLADTLSKLSDDRVKIRIIHTGVGAINESDVLLAAASSAIIIGFNVKPDRNAESVAEREEVDIREYSIIYTVTDEIKKAMAGLLEPTLRETRLGSARVQQIFKTPKAGTVAGCLVADGRITRSGDTQARLTRDGAVIWQGRISGLRRFKDDVSEVKTGLECGISLDRFNDVKVGDIIEVFTVEKIAATV